MPSVNFDPAVGGDGSTVSDDSNPSTGLANYGWKTRFIPALAQAVAVAGWVKNRALDVAGYASDAADSAASAADSAADSAASAADSAANAATANTKAVEAGTSAGASAASAAQAGAAKDLALQAWAASTAPAETLATISQSVHYGAVLASFLYDTSKDSDGGQWRKRCADKSWYTEAIVPGAWRAQRANLAACWAVSGAAAGDYYQNTTDGKYYQIGGTVGAPTQTEVFRGNSRECPALAQIVAESASVVIYDASAPGCPMWMVFTSTDRGPLRPASCSSIACTNARIIVGSSGAVGGLSLIDFCADYCNYSSGSGVEYNRAPIALRNQGGAIETTGVAPVLANRAVNAVAATVLPDAPIDALTGLAVPTIAVGTASGVSVIKHDGTVVNGNQPGTVSSVHISDAILWLNESNAGNNAQSAPLIGISANFYLAPVTTPWTPWPNGGSLSGPTVSKRAQVWRATNVGLVLLRHNRATPASSLLSYITKDYATGWMPGDIKRCWLADTVAETVTGGTQPDRSVKNKPITVVGTLTKTPVAAGAGLVAYSGFSTANYLQEAYSADLDFGTGDFCVMGWAKVTATIQAQYLFERSDVGFTGPRLECFVTSGGALSFNLNGMPIGGASAAGFAGTDFRFIVALRKAGVCELWIDGVLSLSGGGSSATLTNASAITRLGLRAGDISAQADGAFLALWRIGATAPSADAIKAAYLDEKEMFQPGRQVTLAGSSNAATAIAYDEDTDITHVCTSGNRTGFKGLVRVDSEVSTVGSITSISAANGAVLLGGATSGKYYQPAFLLRDEIRRRNDAKRALGKEPVFFDFDAVTSQTSFTVQQGYTVKAVYSAGTLKRQGATKDYTVSTDGFRETVTFGTAPGNTVWVSVMCVRA